MNEQGGSRPAESKWPIVALQVATVRCWKNELVMANESTCDDQIRRLQICINDLVSVQALPAIWSGQGSSQIVATLLDVLVRMLSLDFAFARLSDSINGSPIEFVRLAQRRSPPAEPSEIGRFLNPWLTHNFANAPVTVPNPVGDGEVRIAPFRLGLLEEIGMLIVCSKRADFPTQIEMLLLRVAANQAVVALQEARRLDVTALKRAEESARRSEKALRDVINTVPAHVWSTLPDGTVDFVNQRWQEFTGSPLEDAMGWNWETVIHPDDRDRFVADWRVALESGRGNDSELRLRRKDGTYRWFFVRNVPLRDEQKNIVKWYGTGIDIEDRKRAEEGLQAAMAERTHLAVVREEIGTALTRKDSLSGILHKCVETVVRYLDAAFARIWTLNSDGRALELQASAGMYTRMDGHHSRIPLGELKIGHIARERKAYLTNDVQNDPLVSDREWARNENIISFAGYPLVVEDRVVGVMGMFARKTLTQGTLDTLAFIADGIAQGIERKRAEEALRRSEAYLAEAQKLSKTGSWAYNPATEKAIYWSEEMFRIAELDPQQGPPAAATFLQRVHPEDRDSMMEVLRKAALEKTEYEDHHRLLLPDGTVKYIHGIGHPVFNRPGEVIEYVGTEVDETERKLAEEALRNAQAALTRVTRITTLGEVSASIAHELNQPLTAIVNNANACLGLVPGGTPDLEEAREALAEMVSDAGRASAIIERVRGMARRSAPEQAPLRLGNVVDDVVALAVMESAARRVEIHTQVPPDLPIVLGDRVQLQQVLLNLVVNAMDAMSSVEESERRIEVTGKVDTQENPPAVRISVKDCGTGLRTGEAVRLFEAFYTTKSNGMGLGLAISRSIIEAHGGRLWAESNNGPGATFAFCLPLSKSE
ncbi:MAG: multi-sensor signal transduction histidine kinase [Verrucomicrobiales bacterium]|nr:multi-sensor signal transduction histidine kinase [Verrucomicrobiales bacterium]